MCVTGTTVTRIRMKIRCEQQESICCRTLRVAESGPADVSPVDAFEEEGIGFRTSVSSCLLSLLSLPFHWVSY